MTNINYEVAKEICILTLNRPQQLNALNNETLKDLDKALDKIKADKSLKGVIITGSGEKAFVAGADINELSEVDRDKGYEFARFGQKIFDRIEKLSIPAIALINGYALGGGMELAMACHIRIAVEKAKMGQPETKLGVIPGYGGTQRLPRIIGQGRALELLLTGKMIDAHTARDFGLVNEVVSPEVGMNRAIELIELIASNGPGATARVLSAVVNGIEKALPEALEYEARLFGECCASDEKKEGTAAFLEKRPPEFQR